MIDKRLLRTNGRVAHSALKGHVEANVFSDGELRRVAWGHVAVSLSRQPEGPRDKELLAGQPFFILDTEGDYVFGFDPYDGYVGYVRAVTLVHAGPTTHRIVSAGSHAYTQADMKSFCVGTLSMGSELTVEEEKNGFLLTTSAGFWVPSQHVRRLDTAEDDPVEVATRLLGTPYLWGGNSNTGIDCSGLMQMALRTCGVFCPRDSDQQEALFPAIQGARRRGDLVFWKGHVGMLVDEGTLIHANAYNMAVAIEPLDEAIARIAAREFGEITKIARPTECR